MQEWGGLQAKRSLAKEARKLVSDYIDLACPAVTVSSWVKLSGEFAIAARRPWPQVENIGPNTNPEQSRHRLVIKMNMGAPSARDSMRVAGLCNFLAPPSA